jgi:hypothetical protein
MEQSIASSQENIDARNRLSQIARSIIVGLRTVMAAIKAIVASTMWRFKNALGSCITEPLDIDKISARLRLENRAQNDGRSNQPRSTEEGVSGTQREVVVYFKELQRKAQDRAAEVAKKLHKFGQEIDLLGVSGRLRDIPSRCENEVLRLIADSQSQLNVLGEHETRLQQQYSASLEKGQPNEAADRPIPVIFQWVFIAALTGVAAFAIAKISVQGFGSAELIPPPWTIAIAIFTALASVAIAGAVSRPIIHAAAVRRLMGWIGIALIAVMALCAAQFIAAATINPDVSVRSVADSIIADPIAIATNVADWKGVGIVFAAGVLAFLVSYQPINTHPGHGVIQNALGGARKKRDRLTKRLRKQINAIIDAADVEVTELPSGLKSRISEFSKLVDESKRIPAMLSNYDVALEDGCNILLERYRAANINVRESDVPMSFSEHVCFRPEPEPKYPVFDEENDRLQQFRQGITEFETETVEIRHKLRDLNSRAISALEEIPTSG